MEDITHFVDAIQMLANAMHDSYHIAGSLDETIHMAHQVELLAKAIRKIAEKGTTHVDRSG